MFQIGNITEICMGDACNSTEKCTRLSLTSEMIQHELQLKLDHAIACYTNTNNNTEECEEHHLPNRTALGNPGGLNSKATEGKFHTPDLRAQAPNLAVLLLLLAPILQEHFV